MSIDIYAFYNNKGGVGKTTLCFNAATLYARNNPSTKVLVIDMCPQANISQLLLGGGKIGHETNQKLQSLATRRNIVGFIDWLLNNRSNFTNITQTYSVQIWPYNKIISKNLYLIAGDSFLESLSLGLNYAVLSPINTNAWKEYMTAIKKLCQLEFDKAIDFHKVKYEKMVVFIDCNPSFSIYAQMALVSSNKLVIPMMADFSSLEGIKNLFNLLYGEYTSAAATQYANSIITFSQLVENNNVTLPLIYEFAFNDFTINDGVAKAFNSIRSELVDFCYEQFKKFPARFTTCDSTPTSSRDWTSYYVSDIKDFHSAGTVSSSLGIPLFNLPSSSKYTMPNKEEIKLSYESYKQAVEDISNFVAKFS